ncbi:MAG: beta-lactamase [Gammaproteobacteria bacterium]|nr:beta-lactamase [Gammaproteobacteria bacterium]
MRHSTSIFPSVDPMPRLYTLLATMAMCVLAVTVRAAPADVDARLTEAATAIDGELSQSGLPGLVIGITDRHGLRKVFVHGYGDLKTRKPLTAESRFAIGSISKAFTAIALMQDAQENRFDPHAPITNYLPSLVVHSRFAPITGHDLLSHTAGLPNYLPDSASSRYAAIELQDFEPAYAPGAHWWYSNTGFQLLGYALENIEHEPYTKIVRRRVLEPIGMASTAAIIDDAERDRMVVSYARWPYDGSYVEAPWFEYSAGDGSIVANVADMSAYVRFILNRGMGDKGRVLSESTFATLTTPVLENYAYGLLVRKESGHTVIGHSGSIGGFNAVIEAHMDEGFGLVFLCNASLDQALKKWVVRVVTAAYEGTALPPPPAPSAESAQADLHEYVGQFRLAGNGASATVAGPPSTVDRASGTVGQTLEFVLAQDHLFLKGANGNIPLQRMGVDLYRAVGDAAGILPFVFGRGAPDGKGKITSVSQGALWYAGEGFSEPLQPAAPQEYVSYVGHFVNNGPEGPVARVFVRNGHLMMLLSEDEAAIPLPLEPLGPGQFRIGKEDYSPERARFDTIVAGQALRLVVTGVPLYRKDIP